MSYVIIIYTKTYLLLGDSMFKKYLKNYGYLYGLILILTILLSVFNYFISFKSDIIKIIIPLFSMFASAIILGKKTKEKAYLEGIKFSSIFILITIIIKLLIKSAFNYKIFIMFIAIIISSIIGAMIGINLKKE